MSTRILCLVLLGGILVIQAGVALHHHEDGELHEDCPLYGLMVSFASDTLGIVSEIPIFHCDDERILLPPGREPLSACIERPSSRGPPQVS